MAKISSGYEPYFQSNSASSCAASNSCLQFSLSCSKNRLESFLQPPIPLLIQFLEGLLGLNAEFVLFSKSSTSNPSCSPSWGRNLTPQGIYSLKTWEVCVGCAISRLLARKLKRKPFMGRLVSFQRLYDEFDWQDAGIDAQVWTIRICYQVISVPFIEQQGPLGYLCQVWARHARPQTTAVK